MNNSGNVALVTLTLTAALLAGLLAITLGTDDAAAGDPALKGNNYVLLTVQSGNRPEFVCVVDMSSRRMSLYSMDPRREALDLRDRVELEQAFREER